MEILNNFYQHLHNLSFQERLDYALAVIILVGFAYICYGPGRRMFKESIQSDQEVARKNKQAQDKRYKNLKITKKGKNFKGEYGRISQKRAKEKSKKN